MSPVSTSPFSVEDVVPPSTDDPSSESHPAIQPEKAARASAKIATPADRQMGRLVLSLGSCTAVGVDRLTSP